MKICAPRAPSPPIGYRGVITRFAYCESAPIRGFDGPNWSGWWWQAVDAGRCVLTRMRSSQRARRRWRSSRTACFAGLGVNSPDTGGARGVRGRDAARVSVRANDEAPATGTTSRALRPVHAADLHIQAWARTREACIGEVVSALVGSFVGARLPAASSSWRFEVAASSNADLLRTVVQRVISALKVRNVVPVSTDVTATAAGLQLCCATVDAAAILPEGSIPKGVSEHGARCEPTPGGWLCTLRIDV